MDPTPARALPAAREYKAFISYSHADQRWGARLQRALEHYQVPRRLLEPAQRGGDRKLLKPVFRDREELAADAHLPDRIAEALAHSSALIVICSPRSAVSQWVNAEILKFKRLGRADRIFALIVDGEPHASTLAGGDPARECLPAGLRFELGPDGELSETPAEPLAADARKGADGWQLALLKLVAGVLDISFAALKDREREARRLRFWSRLALGGLLAASVLALVVYFQAGENREANSALFVAEATSQLMQRDYARAEIAAAKALTYRDIPRTRELLLTARLGGVRFAADSRDAPASDLNVFSQDGALVASVLAGRREGAVQIVVGTTTGPAPAWRIRLPPRADPPDSMAFSEANGLPRQLAVAWSEDHGTVFRVGLWTLAAGHDAEGFRELASGPGATGGRHTKRIPAIAFSPDARWPWIATGGNDGKLCLWDLTQQAPRLLWEQAKVHDGTEVHGIAFDAHATRLASGGGDYRVKVWNALDMAPEHGKGRNQPAHEIQPEFDLAGHYDDVFVEAFSPDGSRLASSGYDRTIRIWDLPDRKQARSRQRRPQTIATLSGHEGTVHALAFSKDGTLLGSGASDGSAGLWDAAAGRLLNTFKPGHGTVRSVALQRFEDGLRIGGEHGWSHWQLDGSTLVSRLWNGGGTVNAIAFDIGGAYIAAGGSNKSGTVRVWDRHYRQVQLLDPRSPDEWVYGLAFSPDGRWLVAGGSGQVLHVWDRLSEPWAMRSEAGAPLRHEGAIWGLCFDPRSRWLASSNMGTDIRIRRWRLPEWSLEIETPRGELQDSVYTLACDASGRRIVSGDSKARIVVRDAKSLVSLVETVNVDKGEANVWSLALVDEPPAIVSGNSDGRVVRWTPKDEAWQRGLQGDKQSTGDRDAKVNPTINSVSYDPRHRWIAAGGVGASVEIYDAASLRRKTSLRGHQGTIWWVSFDAQGTRLAYGGLDGIVRVVDLERMQQLLEGLAPDLLYGESQASTGLTIDDEQKIVERRLAR